MSSHRLDTTQIKALPDEVLNRGQTDLNLGQMNPWICDYVNAQKAALDSIPREGVEQLIKLLRHALQEDRQIFVFGNGGSAANAAHFVTDLGKGASDKVGQRFRCLCLNDNVSWMTALANDYAYEEVFVRQLENYGRTGRRGDGPERERQLPQRGQSPGLGQEGRPGHHRPGRRQAGRNGPDRPSMSL